MANVARKYRILGRVQGVGFRYFAERQAIELGVRGYVKNLPNGDVEVYAIGTDAALAALKRRLAAGPRMAHVTGVEEGEEAVERGYTRFEIQGGW